MNKPKLAITLDAEVLERVRKLAVEDSRSLSAYINKVLSDHLREMQPAKHKAGK